MGAVLRVFFQKGLARGGRMTDTFTFYAIYSMGLYWNNLNGWRGKWDTRPRLWSRKADAQQALRYRLKYRGDQDVFRYAIIIPMEVKPL